MEQIINHAKSINKITSNEYFIKLPEINLSDFVKTQVGFVYAVRNWSEVLLNIYLRTNSIEHRRILLKNLFDEHGENDAKKAHYFTFRNMINSIDKSYELIIDDISSNRRIVNRFAADFIYSLCMKIMDPKTSLNYIFGMIGIIEYVYIDVSKEIHKYFKKHNLDIIHYDLHSTLDVEHSTDLFNCIDVEKNNDYVEGINYGYNLFYELYSDMLIFLAN